MENEFPSRKRMRMENYDYSSYGAYFITICTQNKKPILSRIVGGDVLVAPYKTTFNDIPFCLYLQTLLQ